MASTGLTAGWSRNRWFGSKTEEGRKLWGPVEENLLGGSKADDEIALPVVVHQCMWALVLVPDIFVLSFAFSCLIFLLLFTTVFIN